MIASIRRHRGACFPSILRAVLMALGAVAVVVAAADAQNISPGVSVIELPRDQGGITVVVRNGRSTDLPLLFEIQERTILEDGLETYRSAEDSFLIFPPQSVIPAGSNQSVRIRWLDTVPLSSRSFTFFAAEQPVQLEGGSGVRVLARIGASVHVTSRRARPVPVILDAAPVDGGVSVTLGNNGDRYYYVDDIGLRFDNDTIQGGRLADVAGRTLVPPARRRTFVVPDVVGTPRLVK